jgi:hypothetical protein
VNNDSKYTLNSSLILNFLEANLNNKTLLIILIKININRNLNIFYRYKDFQKLF